MIGTPAHSLFSSYIVNIGPLIAVNLFYFCTLFVSGIRKWLLYGCGVIILLLCLFPVSCAYSNFLAIVYANKRIRALDEWDIFFNIGTFCQIITMVSSIVVPVCLVYPVKTHPPSNASAD